MMTETGTMTFQSCVWAMHTHTAPYVASWWECSSANLYILSIDLVVQATAQRRARKREGDVQRHTLSLLMRRVITGSTLSIAVVVVVRVYARVGTPYLRPFQVKTTLRGVLNSEHGSLKR